MTKPGFIQPQVEPAEMQKKLKTLGLYMFIVIISFVFAFTAVFVIIREIVLTNNIHFDQNIFRHLAVFISERNTAIMQFFTFFGSQYFLVPANLFLIFFYFFHRKDKWLGIKVTAVSVTGLVLMFALKAFFKRPRPIDPLLYPVSGLSFPSGHAFMSFSFCCILMYVIYKKNWSPWVKNSWYIFLLAFTFFVGFSRIYLRVHYASDVIAGFCMGFMWVVIALAIVHFIEKGKGSKERLNAI